MSFCPREELETEGTPGRNTWGRWPSTRIRSLLGLGTDLGWGIWSLGFGGEGELVREVREREVTGESESEGERVIFFI